MNSIYEKINDLKGKNNAVILAHYYAPDEVQEIADYVGDSYYLAKAAKSTDADIIVFCGVEFMGESAKILNPDKTVIMPDLKADCPMAHMVDELKIFALKEEYDDLAVVCYINSTAKLKTLSDVCVTSSNALKIVRSLPNKNIFFIPDGNLGRFVKEQIPEKNIILNSGYCPIHNAVNASDIKKAKQIHPNAIVLTHPECIKEVIELSDFVGSTSEIIDYASSSNENEFIICTENGVGYELKRRNPNKNFYFVKEKFECPDMKLNTLEKLCECMEKCNNEVHIDDTTREGALKALDKMLDMAK